MLGAILTTVIAVLGTLAGAITSGWYQRRSAEHAERIARAEALRRDRLAAVTDLAAAVSDHRAAMWIRGDAKLKGQAPERLADLRSRSHQTRSAITRPRVALRVLITDPVVRQAADVMVIATHALRGAYADADGLARAREEALARHDHFVNVAAAYLGN
ncbi:hypothetical protein K388_07124 [Streptomyces sp. KhCrAH-43]|uniref:hypothetical protein n=1 Tax=unclassified Streptomyces TaxID=2593676 RepID=UPI000377036F|nr:MULTISPECIES: hypothetical protein [unclassified Streptomyces]MYS36342.1 hypothetical protein [Streptomyces sp. SID4920]MYX63997.1 hypothetical protein [Streptomyces sp. SID8373]RAJ47847.1 hypothetical protein K388_07124 [Streptomyces sp. KhCrAH-43]